MSERIPTALDITAALESLKRDGWANLSASDFVILESAADAGFIDESMFELEGSDAS